MIQIKRSAEPSFLRTSEIEELRASVGLFYRRREQNRRQERPDFPFFPSTIFKELLDALLAMSHGKCAYCESPIKHPGDASLDRFRPKAGAVGLDREFASEHYWWLAYQWGNLYPACGTCNKIKGPKFPVQGLRAPVEATVSVLASEDRLLVDPVADDPAKHLDFLDSGEVRPRSSRGDVTIATLELNRRDLVGPRHMVATTLRNELATLTPSRAAIDAVGEWLRESLALPPEGTGDPGFTTVFARLKPERPHIGVARAVLERWLAGQTKAGAIRLKSAAVKQEPLSHGRRQVLVAGPGEDVTTYARSVRERQIAVKARQFSTQAVTRIALKNYRGVRDLDLHITLAEKVSAPWLILLGENGTGKSSILQAVGLTLIDEKAERALGVRPKEVLRQGQQKGWVKVWIGEAKTPRVLEFGRGQRRFRRSGPPFYPVLLGYGATRLLPRRPAEAPRGRVRLANMFDPFRPLLDANQWLGGLDRRAFDFAARSLKDVLGLPAATRLRRIRRKGHPGVTLKLFGADLTLDQLSDGYQSVLGLTCDLMSGLKMTGTEALEAAEGLVTLDELGAHLHPRWRMRIVTSLRKAFPRVQFLVSTHDPLCLRGLEDKEAAVLRRTARGRIYQVPDLPPLKGLRVDQLLTSEYFGLDSTMDPAIEKQFRRLYYLLALRQPTAKQKSEVVALRAELAPHEIRGSTRREQRLLEILDRELAQVDQEPDPGRRAKIRSESEAKITNDLNMLLAAPTYP